MNSAPIVDTVAYDDDSKRAVSRYLSTIDAAPEQASLQYHCPALPAAEALARRHFFVMDEFINAEETLRLRAEVEGYATGGHMQDGQVGTAVAGGGGAVRREMRDDRIAWFEGSEPWVGAAMRRHILRMDVFSQKVAIVLESMGKPELGWQGAGRTKIMASLYRGGHYGAKYVPHFDNPNGNGRRLTTILYLNPSWKPTDGGVLRIKTETEVADIAPLAGRLLCFWSDRRCPHEVLPAMAQDRYAITIWYLDAVERAAAEQRQAQIADAVRKAQLENSDS